MREHWLVTLLGQVPKKALYALEGQKEEINAPTAGAALLELVGGGGAFDRVIAVVTPQVRETTLPLLRDYCGQRGVEVQEAPIGPGTDDFMKAFLQAFDGAVSNAEELEVTADLTHGYRHLAVLAYVSLMYLAELRQGVSVRGCYYGRFEKREGEVDKVEICDLAPLVKVPDWLYATRSLRQRADAAPLAKMLGESISLASGSKAAKRGSEGVKGFRDFAKVLSWRCPVDVAESAAAVIASKKNLQAAFYLAGVPLPEELERQTRSLVERYNARGGLVPGRVSKSKPALSDELLGQHARAVSDAFHREEIPVAAGLLREWMVSWAYRELARAGQLGGAGANSRWLERGARNEAERRLGSLAAMANDSSLGALLSDDQRQVGRLWSEVCELRNGLMHYGMRREWALGKKTEDAVRKVKGEWEGWLSEAPRVDLHIDKRHQCLLVSPLGKSPGVLVSALALCEPRPDAVLCVVSEETRGDAERICQEAGYTTSDVSLLSFRDARSGVRELEALVRQSRHELALAGCVRVNLTGGTTLLGLLAQRAAKEAKDLCVPVRSFVLLEPPVGSGDPVGGMVWVDPADQELEGVAGNE
ncbi:MAG: CRISPR-associated DxTHG motif protein [Acidimicrobiales bacterium]